MNTRNPINKNNNNNIEVVKDSNINILNNPYNYYLYIQDKINYLCQENNIDISNINQFQFSFICQLIGYTIYRPNKPLLMCDNHINYYDTDKIKNTVLASSAVIDESAAQEIVKCDLSAVIAPGFTQDAKKILSSNENIILIPMTKIAALDFEIELIGGGILFQTKDSTLFEHWDVKTKNRPHQNIIDEMAFGWPTKYVKLKFKNIKEKNYYDKAIEKGDERYNDEDYSFFLNNCHSYCAYVLNKMMYNGKSDYNMFYIWGIISTKSKYVSWFALFKTYIGFIILVGIILFLWIYLGGK